MKTTANTLTQKIALMRGNTFLKAAILCAFAFTNFSPVKAQTYASLDLHQSTEITGTVISIYPNPVQEKLFIEISDAHQIHVVKIYRANGKEIETIRIEQFQGMGKIEIDMLNFSPGVYFVSVINPSTTKHFRIQKN